MKKTAIAFGIFLLLNVFLSIFQSCCHPDPINFRLISLKSEAQRITGITVVSGTQDIGNYEVEPYIPDEKGIRYDSLGIDVTNELMVAMNQQQWNSSFGFPAAYACSPAENYDIVFDVIITSSEDYNSAYPKGANLDEIMQVRYAHMVRGNNIALFMINNQLTYQTVFYTFSFPPSENKTHDITIKYILTDGREYETTVSGILIRK
jgi:hypothetical protein